MTKLKGLAFWRQIVLAEAPVLPVMAEGTFMAGQEMPHKRDLYIVNVYCCNCSPSFHFDLAIPKGIKAEGVQAHCPNCGVAVVVNDLHQVWPLSHGRLLQ